LRRTKRSVFCLLLLLFPALPLEAQEHGAHSFFHYPGYVRPWHARLSGGLSLMILPRTLVEQEIRQLPMLTMEAREDLPLRFTAIGRIRSNVIANYGSLSGQWNIYTGRISLSVGDEFAYWYGFATLEGFDLTAEGWINFPHVLVGLDFQEFAVTLRAEAQIVTFQKTTAGETVVRANKNLLSGFAIALFIEQPLWKAHNVSLGLKLNYSQQMYQSWLAFSTFRDYLPYTEFVFGFLF
jgi:hypothetical protein